MKKNISQSKKTYPSGHRAKGVVPQSSPPRDGHEGETHGGHDHKRFPTAEEVKAFVGDEVAEALDTELAIMAFERHLIRVARSHQGISTFLHQHSGGSTIHSPTEREPTPAFIVEAILAAIRRRRVDHRVFDASARGVFNRALQKAHQAGTYQQLSAIHANAATHRIHSMQGSIGTQRFLPWHRQYLLQFENLLRSYEPLVRIPYWDYANDRVRPDWVWIPPTVTRNTPPGPGGALPTQQTVSQIQAEITYTGFTFELEHGAHNGVHNWCNGTISAPPTAPQDPIFWLLHANLDRIWDRWQVTHNGVPSLKAMDWILDPFAIPASDVDSIINLGYSYR